MGLQRLLANLLLLLALAVAASFSPEVQRLVPVAVDVQQAVRDGWALVAPGGKLHPAQFIGGRPAGWGAPAGGAVWEQLLQLLLRMIEQLSAL